jgi:hypothetical protein
VNGTAWNISGTTITYTYPEGTAATALTPTITVSAGATVTPASGVAQNFFTGAGVTYTVTAEDGTTTKTYTVSALQIVDSGITSGCTGLTALTNPSTTPQSIDSDVFYNVSLSTRTLRVPSSAVDAYKAATVWKNFGTITGI